MKKYITKILLIPFVGLLFSGCYTSLWMPDENYDSEDIQANEGENFYPVNDYGDYYYFYNRPWWYDAVQTVQAKNNSAQNAKTRGNTDAGSTFKREGRTAITELPTATLPTVSTPAPTVSGSTTTRPSTTDRSGSTTSSSRNSNNGNNDGNRKTSGR